MTKFRIKFHVLSKPHGYLHGSLVIEASETLIARWLFEGMFPDAMVDEVVYTED